MLLNSSKKFISGTTTSVNGAFVIPLPKEGCNGFLVTSFIGMKSDTLRLAEYTNKPLSITLHTAEATMSEVVVKGMRKLFKTDNGVITASVQNTILSKAGSLDKLMNHIPFVSGGGGEYHVFGRGGAIVYLNNRRVYDNDILKTIHSDQIKKVEVITNPNARYAADVKSVIKIFTIDNPNGFGGNVFTNLVAGRRFSHTEGASFVLNKDKWQITGGANISDYKNRSYLSDSVAILSAPEKLYTNNATLDYDMTFLSGNIGFVYEASEKQTFGLNSKLTKYKHAHSLTHQSINHYTNGIKDFHEEGSNHSENEPLQWISNLFYGLSIGKTRIDITNDFLLGQQQKNLAYHEENNAGVSTSNQYKYLMNSIIADINTKVSKSITMNYGGEFVFSQHRQKFSFTEQNMKTELTTSESKNQQSMAAAFLNLNANYGVFSFNAGVRYEYVDWRYDIGKAKKAEQNKTYSNLFPNIMLSCRPNNDINLSLGYRQSIMRPGYSQLNDNIEYQSRYYYVQGNSFLQNALTHSINLLASYKNLRFIGSYDFVTSDIAMMRSVYGANQDIVLSKAVNVSDYKRWSAGLNWWHSFGFYTPYLEVGVGGQSYEHLYKNDVFQFNRPYVNFKIHNTFNLKNNFSFTAFVDYYGKNYSLFREETEQWRTELAVSKSWKQFFVQLSFNNFFVPHSRTSISKSGWVNDASYINNDNRNVSLFVSYNFNSKQRKRNINTKTSEIYRF